MPFLKSHRKSFKPAWRTAEERVIRNGFRIAAFGASLKEKYTGQFVNDEKQGKGVQHYEDKTIYVGDWAHGKRSGHGVFSYDCGNGAQTRLYVGEWDEDKPNGNSLKLRAKHEGYGVKYYPDGGVYHGDFKHGLRQGWGNMKYANGIEYTGDWHKDMKWGEGRLNEPLTMNYYEGEFKKDVKCGRGKYFHVETGQVQIGVWLEDQARVTYFCDAKHGRMITPKMTPFPIPVLDLTHPRRVYREAANEILDQVSKY